MSSPAERYAAARRRSAPPPPADFTAALGPSLCPRPAGGYAAARRRSAHPPLADFTAGLGFSLDPFQVEACEALDEGAGVLVCAPTGAGKTVEIGRAPCRERV